MSATSPTYAMTIGGQAVTGRESFGVVDPATEEVFAQCPDCDMQMLDRAVKAAADAFPDWRRDPARRRQALLDCARALESRIEQMAPILTREQGKPLKQAKAELAGAAGWFRATAGLEIPVEVVQDDEDRRVEVHRTPLGVVAAITPWNFPVMLAVWKLAPALLAGNTVVLKPSPYTPLSSLVLGEAVRAVLPDGVVNVVTGGDALGAWLTEHPQVSKIAFTGSVATGKRVAMAAAPDLKRMTLELGGNDPAIVLDDVDPQKVARQLFWSAFANSGQVCSAVKRLYLHERIYEPVAEALRRLAQRTRMGNGADPQSELGPVNNEPQFRRIMALAEDAKREGGEFLAGGTRLGERGYFFAPSVVSGLSEGCRLVDEEQFGPILPILPFSDEEEALSRANATRFGLSGSVWSADAERAASLASRLECGTAWVNSHLQLSPTVPFGGHKWSGIGVENGRWGLLGFTETSVLNISKR